MAYKNIEKQQPELPLGHQIHHHLRLSKVALVHKELPTVTALHLATSWDAPNVL